MKYNVINYIEKVGEVVCFNELKEEFPDISEKELLNTVLCSHDIITYRRDYRIDFYEPIFFHINSVNLFAEDIENVKKIIDEKIYESGYITYRQLAKEIRERFTVILDKNFFIYPEDLISVFEYHLGKEYYFNWNIISSAENKISPKDIYAEYANKHAHCKIGLNDVDNYGKRIGIPADYDELYKKFVQIDDKNLVPEENIRFDNTKTDKEIDRFCKEDYISPNEITDYSGFPDTGFPWNEYLLGFFVYKYSRKYKILTNNRVNKRYICGYSAIVKRSSEIDTLEKLLITVLAKSNIIDLEKAKYPNDPWTYLKKMNINSLMGNTPRIAKKVIGEAIALRRNRKQ